MDSVLGPFPKAEDLQQSRNNPEAVLLEEIVSELSAKFPAPWGFLLGIPIHIALPTLLKMCSACPGVNLSSGPSLQTEVCCFNSCYLPTRATEGGEGHFSFLNICLF